MRLRRILRRTPLPRLSTTASLANPSTAPQSEDLQRISLLRAPTTAGHPSVTKKLSGTMLEFCPMGRPSAPTVLILATISLIARATDTVSIWSQLLEIRRIEKLTLRIALIVPKNLENFTDMLTTIFTYMDN